MPEVLFPANGWPTVSGIYAIVNRENGKMYVGSAVNFKRRWVLHRTALRSGKHHSNLLQRAWNKYGEAAFEFRVLVVVAEKAILLDHEQQWIDSTKSALRAHGYNVAPIAGSSMGIIRSEATKAAISVAKRGFRHTDETRALISEVQSGRLPSEANRLALLAAKIGIPRPPEVRAKLSAAIKGRKNGPLSDATKAKIGAANKGRKLAPEVIARRQATRARNREARRQDGD